MDLDQTLALWAPQAPLGQDQTLAEHLGLKQGWALQPLQAWDRRGLRRCYLHQRQQYLKQAGCGTD